MLRKIILPVVLLIFAHQEFYGMKEKGDNNISSENEDEKLENINNNKNNNIFPENKGGKWETINNLVNHHYNYIHSNKYIHSIEIRTNPPKLWLLWAILDNVQFQYGNNSKKIWKCAEAYYGLSNGIGFFLNFKWFKIGIIDTHINVINFILNFLKIYVAGKVYCTSETEKKQINEFSIWVDSFIDCMHSSFVMTGIHLLSFNFFNCVKIKIIAIGAFIILCMIDNFKAKKIYINDKGNKTISIFQFVGDQWYFTCNMTQKEKGPFDHMSSLYLILAPRIEINISGIINYFKGQ